MSYVLAMVTGFASAFANSYILFTVLRFFTGFSLTGVALISVVLCTFDHHLRKHPNSFPQNLFSTRISANLFPFGCPAGVEWVDTPHRSFMSVIGSLSWSLGNMLLAVFAYLVNDWRMLILTVTSPLGLAILTWWYEKHFF